MIGIKLSVPGQKRETARKRFTVLIVPHQGQGLRRLRLSAPFVYACAGLAALVLVAGLAVPRLLFEMQVRSTEIEQLVSENARLRAQRASVEDRLGELSGQLAEYEQRTVRLATALGVEDQVAPPPGAGGSMPAVPGGRRSLYEPEIGSLHTRSSAIDQSIEQLDEVFRERIRHLSSTPNRMPTEGWFSHGYGWRKDPFDGDRQFHRGIDIVNDLGTPIVASADGVVSRATRVHDYGKMVDLSHGYGYVTRYAHMHEILVRPGQRVKRGDLIGRMGSTGRSTGPHLHYEVFRDGRRVNPWKYMGQKG